MRFIMGPYSVVLFGNAISAAMGFAVLVVLTRALDPIRFGELAALINVIDFGLIVVDALLFAGVVMTVSKYAEDNPAKADMALKVGFLLRLPIAVAIALTGLLTAEPLSRLLFGTEALAGALRLVFLALPLLTVYSFFVTALQSRQKFHRLALATVYKNTLRLGLLLALFLTDRLEIETAMLALLVGAGLAMLLAISTSGLSFMRAPGFDLSILREIFEVNKWMALAAIGLLGARIDIAMLAQLSNAAEAGFYAAALQLCLVITLFSTALVTVLLPRSARLTDPQLIRLHFRKSLKWLWVGLPAIAVIVPATPYLVPFALGPEYTPVVAPLNLLVSSALLAMVCNPALMAHFSLGLVPLYALTVVVQTVLRVGANLQVMPSHGAVGAAAVDLGVKVLTISVSLAILWIVIERRTASSVTPPLETAT